DYIDGTMPPERYGSMAGSGYAAADRDDWYGDDCGYGGGGGLISHQSAIYVFTAGAFLTFILYRAIKDFETAAGGGRRSNFFFEDILHGKIKKHSFNMPICQDSYTCIK
ncbi:MAG: hypothetical protein GY755_10460, partial [Chloroflexi bacterium]|nr:hypothetical protein [Chloroflexota bacterium]